MMRVRNAQMHGQGRSGNALIQPRLPSELLQRAQDIGRAELIEWRLEFLLRPQPVRFCQLRYSGRHARRDFAGRRQKPRARIGRNVLRLPRRLIKPIFEFGSRAREHRSFFRALKMQSLKFDDEIAARVVHAHVADDGVARGNRLGRRGDRYVAPQLA